MTQRHSTTRAITCVTVISRTRVQACCSTSVVERVRAAQLPLLSLVRRATAPRRHGHRQGIHLSHHFAKGSTITSGCRTIQSWTALSRSLVQSSVCIVMDAGDGVSQVPQAVFFLPARIGMHSGHGGSGFLATVCSTQSLRLDLAGRLLTELLMSAPAESEIVNAVTGRSLVTLPWITISA